MYIGGTDERALHHLAAEILDNAMDEAVAGHASRIELELKPDDVLVVRDNGRGIPVDPHPKFKNKSALEVIMTTLHAGGKFGGKVYDTSGGLHGVGASVVNALSEWMEVEVARDKQALQAALRARPRRRASSRTSAPRPTGAAPSSASSPTRRSSATTRISRRARSTAWRGRRPICSAASRSAGNAIRRCIKPEWEIPAEDVLKFPGGLLGLPEIAARQGEDRRCARSPAGSRTRDGKGAVEWAVAWTPEIDPFVNSYCNTIPTLEGGTHEQGLRTGLTKVAAQPMASASDNRKTALITPDDVMAGACAVLSVFIREPEFQGQTKEKLSSPDAQRLVENVVRDHFDHWLAEHPQEADALLGFVIDAAEDRLQAPPGKRSQPQGRNAQAAPARQARRLLARRAGRHRDLPGRRRLRRRLGQAGARPRDAGHPAACAARS